jgi:hypothetical protein
MTTGAPIKISNITDRVRWSDQIYGLDPRESPMLTFARNGQKSLKTGKEAKTYIKTVVAKLDWRNDYVVQYIPLSTPNPRQPELLGKLVSIVSIYPKEGRSRQFVDQSKPLLWDIDRWPDAVMMREAFLFIDPPILKDIVSSELFRSISSDARNRLGEPGPALYEAIRDMEVEPVLDLYRSETALEYLRSQVEETPSMQVVASRRTGKAGYVYALSLSEHPGLLKIGSAFDPQLRALNLSTGIPTDFKIVDAVLFEDCRYAERSIHDALNGDRHRPDREWFRCDAARFRDIALKTPGCL